eukprot:9333015-Pyramimonas_sp.AAC.1
MVPSLRRPSIPWADHGAHENYLKEDEEAKEVGGRGGQGGGGQGRAGGRGGQGGGGQGRGGEKMTRRKMRKD